MIGLLINLLILCLVFGVVYWIITLIPLPAPFARIAQIVLALIFLLVILNMFFGGGYLVGEINRPLVVLG